MAKQRTTKAKAKPLKKRQASNYDPGMYIFILGFVVISLAVYYQCFTHEFLLIDDNRHITDNPWVKSPSWDHLIEIWSDSFFLLYIPVMYSVWSLLGTLGGLPGPSAEVFHASNIILHIINALLVAAIADLILRKLNIKFWKPWFFPVLAAAIFAWHPIQVEAVSWVAALKDILGLFFTAIYLLLMLRPFSQNRKLTIKTLAVAYLFLLLSMLTKPIAITSPLVFTCLALIISSERKRQILKHTMIGIIACIPFAIITIFVQKGASDLIYSPIWGRPAVVADSLLFYLQKLSLPYPLAPDYFRTPKLVLDNPFNWVKVLALAIAGWWAWKSRKKYSVILLLLLAAIFPLLPVSGLTSFAFQKFSTVADRYLYMSMLPISIIAVMALAKIKQHKVRLAVIVVFLGSWAALSVYQSSFWMNSKVISEKIIETSPGSFMGNITIGNYYYGRRESAKAVTHLQRALLVDDRSPYLVMITGSLLVKERRFKEAEAFHKKYIDNLKYFEFTNPRVEATLHANYGISLSHNGKQKLAKEHFQRSIATGYNIPLARKYLERLK